MSTLNRKAIRRKVRTRIRKKIHGTAERPRLAIHYSNKNIYAQLINDDAGVTIAAASTLDSEVESGSANISTSGKVGSLIAKRAKENKIEEVVFDRGGFFFHGKIKALADAAREEGLKF